MRISIPGDRYLTTSHLLPLTSAYGVQEQSSDGHMIQGADVECVRVCNECQPKDCETGSSRVTTASVSRAYGTSGIVQGHLIGPCSLPSRLTLLFTVDSFSARYRGSWRMFHLNVNMHLWFQHDGAPAHLAICASIYLDMAYSDHWIGRVYDTLVDSEKDLLARIANVFDSIHQMPGVFGRVRQSLQSRCDLSIRRLTKYDELRRSAQQASCEFRLGRRHLEKYLFRRPTLPSYRRGITQHGLIMWLVEGTPALDDPLVVESLEPGLDNFTSRELLKTVTLIYRNGCKCISEVVVRDVMTGVLLSLLLAPVIHATLRRDLTSDFTEFSDTVLFRLSETYKNKYFPHGGVTNLHATCDRTHTSKYAFLNSVPYLLFKSRRTNRTSPSAMVVRIKGSILVQLQIKLLEH
ncbi:hypothetical protein PR048_006119 [Dryococelus australis]|uniref:Uncharacterized protein n=1 Tax=Dryococelus australis TaxID=614101 RepID=A0ABQ9IA60_9NEOP|nr:hypothetical protein PR048_006119 [Dryococelus australis]